MEIYYVEGYDSHGNLTDPIIFMASDANSADTIDALLGLLTDANMLYCWERKKLKSI